MGEVEYLSRGTGERKDAIRAGNRWPRRRWGRTRGRVRGKESESRLFAEESGEHATHSSWHRSQCFLYRINPKLHCTEEPPYLGKGHSAASLADLTQFVQLKRFNSRHKPERTEGTSVAFETCHCASLTDLKKVISPIKCHV